MRRRDLITMLGSATVAWPLATRAQQSAMPVLGFVNSASPKGYARALAAFRKGLAESGYVEGSNVAIEYRWADGQYDRLPGLVADLVQRQVNVLAATSTPAAVAARAATTTVPIVFTTSGDPVKLGLVASLSRPQGNVTGASQLNVEVAPKRLELMHQMLPAATAFGLLVNPTSPLAEPVLRDLTAAAAAFGMKLQVLRATNDGDFATVLASFAQSGGEALVIGTDAFFNARSEELATLTLRHRVPAIYQYPEFTTAGGLMSYGGNVAESYRQAGLYAGRILRGEKPADLPVVEVSKVELIINLRTAKALGIAFPLALLARADEVIE